MYKSLNVFLHEKRKHIVRGPSPKRRSVYEFGPQKPNKGFFAGGNRMDLLEKDYLGSTKKKRSEVDEKKLRSGSVNTNFLPRRLGPVAEAKLRRRDRRGIV